MKVKHLILRLQECDPEAMVVVDGYEGGVAELRNVQDSVEIALHMNAASYYGEHEIDPPKECIDEHTKWATAVYLPRR